VQLLDQRKATESSLYSSWAKSLCEKYEILTKKGLKKVILEK
jgi:hypothetical protein